MDRARLLEVAKAAATAAAGTIQDYYHQGFQVRTKADRTPVTEADEAAERLIRQTLQAAFPEHGFYGEEYGQDRVDAEVVWLIDPIDGTKGFVRGYPFFSTQIAARVRGELVVGVSWAPWMDETAWAIRGEGAWRNGQRASVSSVDRLDQAILSTGNLESMAGGAQWDRLGQLIPRLHRTRGYGDYYHYHLLAGGHIDAVIESDVNILDIAALSVIVEAAGGRFTDLGGGPLDLETRTVLATNGVLHDVLLEAMNGA